jgi:tetratricopeptide (TPR) repeat protein
MSVLNLNVAQVLCYCVIMWGAGLLREEQGQLDEAIMCYKNALALDPSYVDSYLAEALEAEPAHMEAWYQMALLHKAEGRKHEAAKSFQAAIMLEQSSPVEKFSSITPALLW